MHGFMLQKVSSPLGTLVRMPVEDAADPVKWVFGKIDMYGGEMERHFRCACSAR